MTRARDLADSADKDIAGTLTVDALDVDNINVDGNTISSTDTNGDITLDPNGTGDTIIASGSVGIGTTPASTSALQVFSGSAGRSVFRHSGGDGGITVTGSGAGSGAAVVLGNTWDNDSGSNFVEEWRMNMDGSNDSLQFKYNANANTAMTLNSSGNVGINNTSPQAPLHIIDGSGSVSGASYRTLTPLVLENNGNTELQFFSNASNDAQIRFGDGDSNFAGAIEYKHGSDAMLFHTNVTERMRLIGNALVIGATAITNNSTNKKGISFIDDNVGQRTITRSATVNTGTVTLFDFINGNGYVGSITVGGNGTAFNTTSDYRTKENVVDMAGAIDRVKQLSPRRFNFISDATTTLDGFLAHEAATVVPESVTGAKDAVEVWQDGEDLPDGVSVGDNKLDEDGNTIPLMQSIDQSKLVPLLTGALKEAIAKIETLETENTTQATQIADLITRVTALEAAE